MLKMSMMGFKVVSVWLNLWGMLALRVRWMKLCFVGKYYLIKRFLFVVKTLSEK